MCLRAAVSVIFVSLVCGQPYTISTFAGGVPPDNILGTSAGLGSVQGVASDSAGNVFILSGYVVFRLDAATGNLTRIAGNGASGFSGDNGPATDAQIDGFFNGKNGNGLAVDPAGNNLYVIDNGRVRKVSNGVITTVAGGVTPLGPLGGIAVDSAGDLYIADNLNGVVDKVQNGVITTVAGNGTYGFTGDNGPATGAELRAPYNVAVDSAGNVYLADEGLRIRKISNGTITTVAGNGTYGFSGDSGPATSAELGIPNGVAVDSSGNIYIADHSNNRIREVSNGVVTTVAGSSGDNAPATSVQINAPWGIAMDSSGNLYIAEFATNRIRKISGGVITTVAGNGTLVSAATTARPPARSSATLKASPWIPQATFTSPMAATTSSVKSRTG